MSISKTTLGSVCTSILEHPAFVEAEGVLKNLAVGGLVEADLPLEAHVVAFSFKFENQTALQVAEEIG